MVTKKKDEDKANAESPATEEKQARKPRTVLTPAEKIAKLEAELAAAKKAADDKAAKRVGVLVEQRDKKVAKRDALNTEIASLNEEIEALSPSAQLETGAPDDESGTPAGNEG